MFSFLKSDTKDLLERLDNAIVECGKAIALYHEKNLIDDEIQEKMILNELEYIKHGDFSRYMTEKSNLSHEQILNRYKKKEEEKNEDN